MKTSVILPSLLLPLALACSSNPPPSHHKSAKRGIAYETLKDEADFRVLSPGLSWWYNWDTHPKGYNESSKYGIAYIPMLWNDKTKKEEVVQYLNSLPAQEEKFFLVLNEPNIANQANMLVEKAVEIWPGFEEVATKTGAKLVGPQITWGTETFKPYNDPVAWLDKFFELYRKNFSREPRIDYLGFHWYDYGLAGQLDRLKKFGKKIWVTEMANMHNHHDGADIDSVEKQKKQMQEMVGVCESRDDVARYAWWTGRVPQGMTDTHFVSLLGDSGELTDLGKQYIQLP